MESSRMLACLEQEAELLLEAATPLELGVPACPGWTVRDVLLHTGEVYAHKAAIVGGDLDRPPKPWPPRWDRRPERRWFSEQRDLLLTALAEREPAHPVWTWYPPETTVGFWTRRMLHETVIHRVDVQVASGRYTEVAEEAALDGIDEVLERFLVFRREEYRGAAGQGEVLRVSAADRSWVLRLDPDRAFLEADGTADASVAGAPAKVVLALWNRLPYSEVETSGDPAALRRLRAALAATTG